MTGMEEPWLDKGLCSRLKFSGVFAVLLSVGGWRWVVVTLRTSSYREREREAYLSIEPIPS